MAINANFYALPKRDNSTKIPGGSESSFTAACSIYEPCDALDPTLRLEIGGSGDNPTLYNYCAVPDFGRRYWVRWEWTEGRWLAHCTHDPLGSWRTQILASSCMVLRSGSAYDPKLVDSLVPVDSLPYISRTNNGAVWSSPNDMGLYGTVVVGVQGDGTCGYYAFSYLANFNSFLSSLFSDASLESVIGTDLWGERRYVKGVVNPLQFIQSVTWIPRNVTLQGSEVQSIRCGYFPVSVTGCYRITKPLIHIDDTITVPKHPDLTEYGDWLMHDPYSSYQYYMPGLGVIPVSADVLYNVSTLDRIMEMDLRQGTIRVKLQPQGGGSPVVDVAGSVGLPLQIGALSGTNTLWGLIQNNAGGGSGGSAAGIPHLVLDTWTALRQGIPGQVAASAKFGSVSSVGSDGSCVGIDGSEMLTGYFQRPLQDVNSLRGRPLCRIRRLGDLSGYCQVLDGDIEVPATDTELREIRALLEGGIYIE